MSKEWVAWVKRSDLFGWEWGVEHPDSWWTDPDHGVPTGYDRNIIGWAWTEKRARRAACDVLYRKTHPKPSTQRIYIDCDCP